MGGRSHWYVFSAHLNKQASSGSDLRYIKERVLTSGSVMEVRGDGSLFRRLRCVSCDEVMAKAEKFLSPTVLK